jgi:hypothetical protein
MAARIERGGAAVRGQSWKGRRGEPAWGGAQGGDGRAEGWPEEAALGGQGCGGRCWHNARRNRGGREWKTKVKKGELIGGALPL